MKSFLIAIVFIPFFALSQSVDIKNSMIKGSFKLPNTVAPLDYEDDYMFRTKAREYIPMSDVPFIEHERASISPEEEQSLVGYFKQKSADLGRQEFIELVDSPIKSFQVVGDFAWIGTTNGLYKYSMENKQLQKHTSYGIEGPLSTHITSMVRDSRETLWFGTPIGLSGLKKDGKWLSIRGSEGLPIEEITALAINQKDDIWIGTSEGAILYKPYEQGRQWYYRAGKRYLIDDQVQDIFIPKGDSSVYFKTKQGFSKISFKTRTLAEKAQIMEDKVGQWHRRLGMVVACELDDPESPTYITIKDSPNDGLWTSYHVVAMSLAYATTKDEAYLQSAKKGMNALIMLQNASGIPGVIARSVLPVDDPKKNSKGWRLTPDGKMIWKDDTSSDEIDGHFFGFYAYWEHIARHDPEESALIQKQISKMMNHIVDNNYQLLDWNGKRTKWGFWNPEELNDNPEAYLEKKVFPDKNNHSDNQLGYCALYPLLQLEYDPRAREALQKAVRRHHRTLSRDGSSFFYFSAATIDLDYVELSDAVDFLRQMPTDRRQWKMTNSKRADIIWHPYKDRFDKAQLLYVLPADERNFDRWNKNPYYADGGRGGKYVDGEASWLLAYWMGRYHGFIGDSD